ncbi:MAG: DinB family protein [Phycisphaerales bacterium]
MHEIDLLAWWDGAWDEGLWYAPWSKAIDGLTPEQAAWTPGPGRHSIWSIVNHMSFWREHSLRTLRGQRPTSDEVERRNFEGPLEVTEAGWRAARERFASLQEQIRSVIADPAGDLSRIRYHLPHDSYHVGQIMYLRAMQGLPAIE